MLKAELLGQTDTHLVRHPQFGLVHRAVVSDLQAMAASAAQDGIDCQVFSGFRHFKQQSQIWDKKWTGQRPLLDAQSFPLDYTKLSEQQRLHAILRWSALPGASRHHWGSDFDLFDPQRLGVERLQLIPQEYCGNGHQAPLAQWLTLHAADYGFFYPYQRYQGGVAAEPWHLSHRQTAGDCLCELNLEDLYTCLEQSLIEGKRQILDNLEHIYKRYITNICH